MSNKSNVKSKMTIKRDGENLEIVIEGVFLKGSPGVHTLSNGDPGYPDDPDEINDVEASLPDGTPIRLTDLEYEEAVDKLLEEIANSSNNEDPDEYDYRDYNDDEVFYRG